jgi:hypothetical protein
MLSSVMIPAGDSKPKIRAQEGDALFRYDLYAPERSPDQAMQRLFTGVKPSLYFHVRSLTTVPGAPCERTRVSVLLNTRRGDFNRPVSPLPQPATGLSLVTIIRAVSLLFPFR